MGCDISGSFKVLPSDFSHLNEVPDLKKKKAYIKTFISTAGTVLETHEDADDSASAAANTTQVLLHHLFPPLVLLMNL